MSNRRGHKRLIPGSGESYTTTRVRGRSSLLIRVADPPPPPLPGSVAVARLEAFRCDTLRDHHVIGAHLLRRPSRQYVRECFIQFRAPAHPVAWFATGKSHIVVQSRRVWSRSWRGRHFICELVSHRLCPGTRQRPAWSRSSLGR